MILDSTLSYDLTQGDPKRRPQADDAAIVVPPMVLPVALAARPHVGRAASATPTIEDSCIQSFQRSNTNTAQTVDDLVTLSKGLWELELTLSTFTNWISLGVGEGARIILTYMGLTITLVHIFAITNSAQVGLDRRRLLLKQQAVLSLLTTVTGAGQTTNSFASANCIRIL